MIRCLFEDGVESLRSKLSFLAVYWKVLPVDVIFRKLNCLVEMDGLVWCETKSNGLLSPSWMLKLKHVSGPFELGDY